MDKESGRLTILCNAALAVLNGVLDRMDHMREDHVRELFGVLREHYSGILLWMTFLAQDIAVAQPDGPNPRVGTRAVANTLKRLLDKGKIKYLKDDLDAMEEFVDIVLVVWITSVPGDDEEDSFVNKESYPRSVKPIFDMLWNCLWHEPAKSIALEKLGNHGRSFHTHLAHSLSFRCQQWAKIYAGDDNALDRCTVFIGTALVSQMLTKGVPTFSKILAKSAFPSVIMESAMEFPLESNRRGIVAIPVQIAQLMLSFQPPHAYEIRRVVPEILRAGALKVIVHQLLSPRATLQKPFPDWLGRHPFLELSSLCFTPAISYAMSLAFGDLSEDTMEVLWTDPLARKHWRPFFRAVGAYQQAYDQSWEDSDGEVYDDDDTQITLCDNIDHGEVDGRHMLAVDAVKCSWCQAVVYCSEECQRHDWKKLHRQECTRDRVYRIDRQLNGAWISHRSRMLIFRVHELFLQKAVPLMAPLPLSPAGKPVPFMDHTTLPLSMKLFDMECLKTLAQDGVPIYGDKRSQALIKEYEDDESDTIRLAGGIAPNGQYMVAILGSFVVEPKVESDSDEESENDGSPTGDSGAEGDSEGEGRQSEELPSLTLKNGYIRIIEVANPDKACEMEFHRGMTGIMRLSFEPPDESDAYDSD